MDEGSRRAVTMVAREDGEVAVYIINVVMHGVRLDVRVWNGS